MYQINGKSLRERERERESKQTKRKERVIFAIQRVSFLVSQFIFFNRQNHFSLALSPSLNHLTLLRILLLHLCEKERYVMITARTGEKDGRERERERKRQREK